MPKKIDSKTKAVYTRITPALQKKLKLACANRDIKQPDAIEQAISAWISPPAKELRITPTEAVTAAQGLQTSIGVSEKSLIRWKAQIEQLVRVLESGNPDAVSGITMNLEWADSWVRTHNPDYGPEEDKGSKA